VYYRDIDIFWQFYFAISQGKSIEICLYFFTAALVFDCNLKKAWIKQKKPAEAPTIPKKGGTAQAERKIHSWAALCAICRKMPAWQK